MVRYRKKKILDNLTTVKYEYQNIGNGDGSHARRSFRTGSNHSK